MSKVHSSAHDPGQAGSRAHAWVEQPSCEMAHGHLPARSDDRRLVAVFASAVAAELAHMASHVGFDVVLLEPDPQRVIGALRDFRTVADADAAGPDLHTDVVVTDHDRPELGDVLAAALRHASRWVGVMGSPRHPAPHLVALRERHVSETDIARVHRPIGLDIGSKSPAEIAISTVAGLLADRNKRPGTPF